MKFCLNCRLPISVGEQCGFCALDADQAPITMFALPAGAYALCPDHDILYHIAIGARCPMCLAEQAAAQRREIINVLQSRIADQDAELFDVRQRATVLEHQLLAEQERTNREARELEGAYRILESPTTRAEFKAAAQMRIDQIGAEREQRTLACAILRIARLEAKLDEWIGHVNFKLQVLDPDTDGL